MVAPVPSSAQPVAPPVVTVSNTGSEAQILQALIAGANPNQQAALQAQLALLQKRKANKLYVSTCIEKHAPALTNGSVTQAYVNGQSNTFSLPTPNNSYCRGIIIRLSLNYTLAAGSGATYGLTAAGALALLDSFEIRYNQSQIKMRPKHLRDLAMMGALGYWGLPDAVMAGYSDATLQSWLFQSLPTATGAQTWQGQFFVPFNILNDYEDRGLLPSMPGGTGIQVIINTPTSIFGSHPLFNAIYETGGTGGAVSAVSGTLSVESVYYDGENMMSPTALAYDMSVLDGTIQMQMGNQILGLTAGTIMRNQLNILGKHKYVILTVIDGEQSSVYATRANIQYLESSKDDVGANVFWKYGSQTNMSVYDYDAMERRIHRQDLDPGVYVFVEGPLRGQSAWGARDGHGYLDNTKNGWPAWHYGIQLGAVTSANGIAPMLEPFMVYVNPVGLTPVG